MENLWQNNSVEIKKKSVPTPTEYSNFVKLDTKLKNREQKEKEQDDNDIKKLEKMLDLPKDWEKLIDTNPSEDNPSDPAEENPSDSAEENPSDPAEENPGDWTRPIDPETPPTTPPPQNPSTPSEDNGEH